MSEPNAFRRAIDRVARSLVITPVNAKDPAIVGLFDGGPTSAGVSVNEWNAMNVAAVHACVQVLTGAVVSLPLKLFVKLPGGGRRAYVEHPLSQLLRWPNPEMTMPAFLSAVMSNLLLGGNFFAEIERDAASRPCALWPLPSDRVRVDRDERGAVVYVVRQPDGTDALIPSADMVHVVGLSRDGLTGMSVVRHARESLGLTLAMERFGSEFFAGGSWFGGFLCHPKSLSPTAVQNIRKAYEDRHEGLKRSHRLALLMEGMTYQERKGIPPADSQLLEGRLFQTQEIARWFGVPPSKIGDLSRSTFSNVESEAIAFYTDAVVPWLRRVEAELNRKLIASSERNQQYAEFVTEGALRGDSAARAGFYREMLKIGALTVNEVRERENLNPVAGGDVALVDQSLVPLARVVTGTPSEGDGK